jgi:hypothetical protein
MSRDEVHIRDRLLLLAECSNPHKPFNVKRKSTLTKQGSKSGPKLSVQDFVRMDPGYTPDIEHLVFPARKRNPQQVAPLNPPSGKTRSRLAEMFALSRHLQQRSADRDSKTRNPTVNVSIYIDCANIFFRSSKLVKFRVDHVHVQIRKWCVTVRRIDLVRSMSSLTVLINPYMNVSEKNSNKKRIRSEADYL